MKRTQLLDALRHIRREFVAFLSIAMIGMLASGAFLSVAYSAATLKEDALRFYAENNFWDLELVSTMLFERADLDAVRAVPGVREAEALFEISAQVLTGEKDAAITVLSLPERVSRPVLREGRLPEQPGECAAELTLLEEQGLSLGDTVTLACDTIAGIDPLPEKSFVITGAFDTPDHINTVVSSTPYLLVSPESFDAESLDGCFMKIRVALDAPYDRYSEAYWETVRPVKDAMNALAETRATLRTESLRRVYEERLLDAQKQLEDGEEQLRLAREKIDAGYRELETGAEQLNLGKDQLDSGADQLFAADTQIAEGAAKLRQTAALLETARACLTDDPEKILSVVTEESWPADAPMSYEEFEQTVTAENASGVMDWLYEASGYNAGREALAQAQARVEAARASWYYLGEEYLDGLTRLEQGKKQLEEGERELAEGEAAIAPAREELRAKQEELAQLRQCRWILLDDRANAGYVYVKTDYEKLASMSMTFSMVFLVVGALVIYATVGRMVEQQRKLIGATKAMGFYNREIFAKYLSFACGGTALGLLLGVFGSWLPMQRLILSIYEQFFRYGKGGCSFLPRETAAVAAGALVISAAAVYLGCGQLLRQSAIRLMQGTPPAGGRKKARRSAHKTLYTKLIFLNMRTDWRRVLVTAVSIAGGCLLLVVGFTLRFGVSRVMPRQFGEIVTYQAEIYFTGEENPDAAAEIAAMLEENGLPYVLLRKESGFFEMAGNQVSDTMIVAEDGALEGFFALRDIEDGAVLPQPESGMLAPRRFHEYYGVSAGEDVTLYDTEMLPHSLRVAGFFENYFGQLFFLTPQAYEEAFGMAPEANCFFVKTNGMELARLGEKAEGVVGFERVADAAADKSFFEQFSSALNFVIVFMLFLAGLMSSFIVANFSAIYIERKTPELTIMRINGFSAAAVIRYAAVDLIVTTVLGTALGLFAGRYIGALVLGVTEAPYLQMARDPAVQTYLYSALITVGFSAVTNSLALRRVKKLKLSDMAQ